MGLVKASHIVKPCEDTPNVVMPVSDCDQIHRITHSLLICFYRSGNPFIHILKDSLSKTLVIFYPLAGRLQWLGGGGRVEIHCNSKGALLIEAESESRVDDYGDFRPTPELQLLIPAVDYGNTPLQEQPLLLAQVTRFACGGIALGFAVSHVLADGESVFQFIGTWARIARGEEPDGFPFLDRKVLQLEHPGAAQAVDISQTEFAPPPLLIGTSDNLEDLEKATSLLLLKLSKNSIQKLKDIANKGMPISCRSYSSFEVVVAHIWRCATKVQGHHSEQLTNSYIVVGFRNRLKPSLPINYFGNAVLRIAASATSGELQKNPLSYAASRIRQTIDKATNEYLRLNLAFYKQLPDISSYRYANFVGNPNLIFSTWANLPFFGMDFGWGKEIYMGPGAVSNGVIIIFHNHEDDGSWKVMLRFPNEHIDAFQNLFYSCNIFSFTSNL